MDDGSPALDIGALVYRAASDRSEVLVRAVVERHLHPTSSVLDVGAGPVTSPSRSPTSRVMSSGSTAPPRWSGSPASAREGRRARIARQPEESSRCRAHASLSDSPSPGWRRAHSVRSG